jgi:Protein of unknown function (DUF3037)
MLKDEGGNIGIVVVADAFVDVRFVTDWNRVLALDPDADIDFLKGLTCGLRSELLNGERRKEVLFVMEQSCSNAFRLSPWKGCLTQNPATEIETLAAQYP